MLVVLASAAIAPASFAGTPPTAPMFLGDPGLAVGQITDTRGIPIGMTWIPPADVGSGLATYEFERSKGACATWIPVGSIAAPGTTTAVLPIPPARRKSSCLRMRAVDTMGHAGEWAYATIGKLALYQERATTADATGTRVMYSGAWARQRITGASAGAVKWSGASDATANFEFHGTSIAIVTDKMPGHGSFFLWIDGNHVDANPSSIPVDPFNTDSATTVMRDVIWSRNGLSAGDPHTLTVQPSGNARIDVDAFVVRR
jgi:hypothetical protein